MNKFDELYESTLSESNKVGKMLDKIYDKLDAENFPNSANWTKLEKMGVPEEVLWHFANATDDEFGPMGSKSLDDYPKEIEKVFNVVVKGK